MDSNQIHEETIPLVDTHTDDCVEIEIPLNLFQYLSTETCNVEHLCRICLATNNSDMYSLFSTDNGLLLRDMFTSFTAISVNQDDGLPSQICEMCRAEVLHCYEFRSKCVKSDSTLRSLLKGEFVTKEEPCDYNNINSKSINEHKIKDEDNVNNEIKKEEDYLEDIEYLENDLNDVSDNDDIYISSKEKKTNKKKINYEITDAEYLLNDIKSGLTKPRDKKLKSFVCSFCSKKFSKAKSLDAHSQRCRVSRPPHACALCAEVFSCDHDLRLHAALHAGPAWRCSSCHKEFKERSMLRRHIQRHMQSKRYACDACGKTFTELYALRRHVRVHTGERVEKRHACHICDKRYSESGLLTAHLARHKGTRPCVCAACGKTFPSARLLASHHLVHSDDKPHACRYCDKRFRHESTRNTHHRTHTGEKPYVCATCGKAFIQNSNLTLHMRTHTGEKPYTCSTCGRAFSSGSTLKAHARTHTGEKPYGCHVCGKRFARMDMSAHMRLHTGERPHACGACPRRFATAARLRDHARVHTGEKPFECSSCSLKFTTKSHLVKHAKTHQPKKKVEREVVIVRQVDYDRPFVVADKYIVDEHPEKNVENEEIVVHEATDEMTVETHEVPLEVSEELVVNDEDEKSDVLVVDSGPNTYQDALGGNYGNDVSYANDNGVNLVTVNEGGVSISASSVLEGATVKLYQLDQSLVQIHSSGGQFTISKITSKMTANF